MTGQAIDAAFPDIPAEAAALVGGHPRGRRHRLLPDVGHSLRARRYRSGARLAAAAAQRAGAAVPRRPDQASAGRRRRSISKDDVRRARANKDVATQVAAYFDLRNRPKSEVEIAEAEAGIAPPAPTLKSPPTQIARPAPRGARRRARDGSVRGDARSRRRCPSWCKRRDRQRRRPSDAERGRLNQLVTLASLSPTDVLAQRLQTADADRHLLDQLGRVRRPSKDRAPAPRSQAAAHRPEEGNAGRLARRRIGSTRRELAADDSRPAKAGRRRPSSTRTTPRSCRTGRSRSHRC